MVYEVEEENKVGGDENEKKGWKVVWRYFSFQQVWQDLQ